MNRKILYSLIGLVLLITFTLKSGLISIGISPYYHHKLSETETQIFDSAITKMRERVETGNYDEIQNDLAEGRVSRTEIIDNIKKAREKFGKPVASEFFRSSVPEPASTYYKNIDGTFYEVHYFTKTENVEFFESIQWTVNRNNDAKILNYSGSEIVDWQRNNQEIEKYIKENYSNELRIPFGDRFIEIRY